MNYTLPGSIEAGGTRYQIRTDYRCALDALEALGDPGLSTGEKGQALLEILCFSPSFAEMPPAHWQEALGQCVWFLDGGDTCAGGDGRQPLMDWGQDFPRICAPINRVYGQDIRAVPYDPSTNTGGLHWWTFLGLYMEIGDCFFAQVVRIRDMKARGKKLDKQDREFYRRNRPFIDLKTRYTEAEKAFLKEWGAG